MNCAEYEQSLARWMAGDEADGRDEQRLARLKAHAAACEACRGSADLLDLLALPAGERDGIEDPGEAYWASFEERLRPRLKAAPKRSHGPWWAVAAAVLLLGLLAGWLLRGPGEPEAPAVIADAATGPTVAEFARTEFPASLVESLGRASAEEVDSELAALESLGVGESEEAFLDEGLFPEVDRLDAETRERLLDWLRDQNQEIEGAQG